MHGYRAVFRFGQYSDDIFQKTVGSGLRLIRKILRKLKTFWLFGAGPAALIATALIAPNVPEDWAARHSNGHPGIWTVTEVRCRSFCKSWGDFVPDDGTPGRQHVERAGDSELGPDEVGSRLPAIDVDARSHVLVPGGGRARATIWVFSALVALSGIWAVTVAVTSLRRY